MAHREANMQYMGKDGSFLHLTLDQYITSSDHSSRCKFRLNSTVISKMADQNRVLSSGQGDCSCRDDNFRPKRVTLTHKNAAASEEYSTVLSFTPLTAYIK